MYLDCYHDAALLGNLFPVNSYGPASIEQIEKLQNRIKQCFTRTTITEFTKGQCPLPEENWPKLDQNQKFILENHHV